MVGHSKIGLVVLKSNNSRIMIFNFLLEIFKQIFQEELEVPLLKYDCKIMTVKGLKINPMAVCLICPYISVIIALNL